MEVHEDASSGSPLRPGSDSKKLEDKWESTGSEQRVEISRKRPYVQSGSTVDTSGTDSRNLESGMNRELGTQSKSRGGETSGVTDISLNIESVNNNHKSTPESGPAVRELDLNASITNSTPPTDGKRCKRQLEKQPYDHVVQRGIGVDLNADAVSSSVNDDSLCPSRFHDYVKSRDMSECGSSAGPFEVKDPMSVWKGLKQNGFLSRPHSGIASSNRFVSSSYGGIPVPRKRGRKSKDDSYKRRIELAKRVEVDKFAKMAAPSGLLNELNPGIINHVRNKKQVHSIIQAIVRSECEEMNKMRSGSNVGCTRKTMGDASGMGPDDGPLSNDNQMHRYSVLKDKSFAKVSDRKTKDADPRMVEAVSEDDAAMLKLSSLYKVSENLGSLSNEGSANCGGASSLTIKAATVASQWLDLLHQDAKGRLMALRRSRKRVRAVISTELPFLALKEFPSNQENGSPATRSSADRHSGTSAADMHQARWSMLFSQMDQALAEEEKELETWLEQVKELQLRCDQGLQHFSWGPSSFHLGITGTDPRIGRTVSAEKQMAVQAAAASIYSTCNFLFSKTNMPCS